MRQVSYPSPHTKRNVAIRPSCGRFPGTPSARHSLSPSGLYCPVVRTHRRGSASDWMAVL